MKNLAKPSVQLVFTVAFKEELPLEWLAASEVEVHALKSLKAGAWRGREASGATKKALLVVVTGVGPGAAREAALWIRANLEPLFVVNLGTAAAIHPDRRLGEWVAPEWVTRETNQHGDVLPLDTRVPFPWPESIPRRLGGALLSVETPRFGDLPAIRNGCQYVDMECFAQAEVFAGTNISFHAIKWISDFSDANGRDQFQNALPRFRREVQRVLAFLRPEPDQEISVIIPVHNRRPWIGRCVDSVLRQTLPAREVIVVDDGSHDGTREALAVYRDRIIVLCQPENRGVSAARNCGIARASSPWVCFLDSDDLWEEDKLERQWRFFQAHPFYEVFQCGEVWIRNGRRVNPCKHHEKPQGWMWKPSLARCLVSPSAVMLRHALLELLGGFDEGLAVCEDYDLWLRIARHHVVGLDPSPSVIKHGGHEDQLSRRFPAMDSFRVQALLKAVGRENDPWHQTELRRVLQEKLRILIQGSRKRGKLEQCREYEACLRVVEGV